MHTTPLTAGRLFGAIALTAFASIALLLAGGVHAGNLTRDNGAPVDDNQNSQTAGPDGRVR